MLEKSLSTLDIAKRRFEVYEFLSYCLLNEPEENLIDLIKSRKGFFEGLEVNIDFLDDYNMEDIEQEYYDRFFVPTSKIFVPPYESAIRNRKMKKGKIEYGRLDSEDTFHVKACYEIVGFKVDELNAFGPLKANHYPDHLAFELSFITNLVKFELNSLEHKDEERADKWRKLQRDFIIEHISQWIDDYAELVEGKQKGLYSFICNIIASWIEEDMEFLNSQEN